MRTQNVFDLKRYNKDLDYESTEDLATVDADAAINIDNEGNIIISDR